MNNPRKSSFKSLVEYLVDDQDKLERVAETRITNCHSDSVAWASMEIEATQARNTRAISDKTYHLIISFREGENPPGDVLESIENEICEALGFEEHQRISVTHRDTDNLHIHLAINKIHPEKLTLHEPYRDHYVRDKKCIELEKKYGLEVDNHKNIKTISEGRASDMEAMSGLESLLSHVKTFSSEINNANSWDELHHLLYEKGVTLKERGNGFVFSSGDYAVKASSVNRDFSKSNLIEKLGEYEKSQYQNENDYSPQPINFDSETKTLFQIYKEEQEKNSKILNRELLALAKHRSTAIKLIKSKTSLKRQLLKLATPGVMKRIALKHINNEQRKELNKLHQEITKSRNSIFSQYKRQSWKGWLKTKVMNGDAKALSALEKSNKNQSRQKGNTFYSPNKHISSIKLLRSFVNNVTNRGTVVYKVANTAIRERKNSIKLGNNPTENGMYAALVIAAAKYGDSLSITGNDEFKEKVAAIVANKNLAIHFTDDFTNKKIEELKNDREERRRESSNDAQRDRTKRSRATRSRTTNSRRGRDHKQPYSDGRRRLSEAQRIHNMSTVSELSMVQLEQRTKLLLPGDARNNLEQRKADSSQSMRWNLSRSGRGRVDAVSKFISERDEKRKKIFDIPIYRRYTESVSGDFIYKGLRNKEGESLLLVSEKDSETILVKSIDAKTKNRVMKLKVGDAIRITPTTVITKKGLKR